MRYGWQGMLEWTFLLTGWFVGSTCRTKTTYRLLCFKSKFPNHFAFTLGRYLFLLFFVFLTFPYDKPLYILCFCFRLYMPSFWLVAGAKENLERDHQHMNLKPSYYYIYIDIYICMHAHTSYRRKNIVFLIWRNREPIPPLREWWSLIHQWAHLYKDSQTSTV